MMVRVLMLVVLGLSLVLFAQAEGPVSPGGNSSDTTTSPCFSSCLEEVYNDNPQYQRNISRICDDKGFFKQLDSCMDGDCGIGDDLRFHFWKELECHLPVADRRHAVNTTASVFGVLALVFFGMRFVSKIIGFVSYGTDDSLILAAFPLVILLIVATLVLTSKGLGLDIWHVRDNNITAHYQFIMVFGTSYALSLALIKLSILAFFLRVFPNIKFRRVVHLTMAFIVVMTIAYGVVFALQRKPLWMFWEGWKDKDHRGLMLDTNATAISHASINVALDVWMMILPITQLWRIGIKQKKKFGIIAMFSVGIFLTVVSAVRIPYVTNFETSKNSTFDSVETIVWSVIEACVGVMVACMPGARQCVRDITARVRRRRAEDGESRTGIFVDRSLATIVMTRQQTTYGTGSSDSGSVAKPYAAAEINR